MPISSFVPTPSSTWLAPSSTVLERPLDPALRSSIPIVLPPLRQSSVSASTFKNYSDQLRYFLVWLKHNGISPTSAADIDAAFEAFLHGFFAARNGRGLALARNALCGLCLVFPHLNSSMPLSRRAIKGWEKLCPSSSHPPLSWSLTCLLAVHLVSSTPDLALGVSCAVGMLLAWDAYLRVGELCSLRVCDLQFNDVGALFKTSIPAIGSRSSSSAPKRLRPFAAQPVLASLHLQSTKTGPNQWAQVRSPLVVFILHHFMLFRLSVGWSSARSSKLFPFSTDVFRKEMARVRASLGLAPEFTPHSLRHGHATADYEAGATVQDIAVRGRWRTLESLLIYVQSGPALAVRFRPPPAVASLATSVSDHFCPVFVQALLSRVGASAPSKR